MKKIVHGNFWKPIFNTESRIAYDYAVRSKCLFLQSSVFFKRIASLTYNELYVQWMKSFRTTLAY